MSDYKQIAEIVWAAGWRMAVGISALTGTISGVLGTLILAGTLILTVFKVLKEWDAWQERKREKVTQ